MTETHQEDNPSGQSRLSHPLDRALQLKRLPYGRGFSGHTSKEYWNLVGPFGGITAAVMLNAFLLQEDRLGDPVALTVNFAGPIKEGEFEVLPRLLRTSRSTQHWSAELYQGEDSLINAVAVFGTRRDTWGDTEAARPAMPDPATIPSFPRVPQVNWPNCYDLRFVQGGFATDSSGTGLADSLTSLWIADHPPRNLDFPALASICDSFFPRIFSRRSSPPPMGTVSLNIHFHTGSDELAGYGAASVFATARGQVFHRGFFDQIGQIWGKDGNLLATTQQMVWFKE